MDKLILLDALYINDSGGKILLDYLIQELEKSGKIIYYLLDKRVENRIPTINSRNKLLFLKGTLYNRRKFYKNNIKSFSTVLCFGNLPPNIRLQAKVFTYFHQQLYINIPKDTSLKLKFLFFLKRNIFRFFSNNTDYWLMQTDLIKTNFSNKFNVDSSKILVSPFYPDLLSTLSVERSRHSYVYVSNASPHKNHIRLINAFCLFYDKYKIGKLILTVGDDFLDLLSVIKEKINLNYPIINIGFIERKELANIYKQSEYLIYPSTAESFGLGIIEAIEKGCKVVGANLPYMYAVCHPSLTFDPLDEKSIFDALSLSLDQNTNISVAKVSNKIHELISLLE